MRGSTQQTSGGGAAATPEIEVVAGEESGELGRAVRETLSAADAAPGHLTLALVPADEIQRLNREHRGIDAPTDVLSFPVDERGAVVGPRELGDVVICPEQTDDLVRAAVHGVLHLLGHDHETDGGEMMVLEERIVAALG
jgi:probable rRNA maturation factor